MCMCLRVCMCVCARLRVCVRAYVSECALVRVHVNTMQVLLILEPKSHLYDTHDS